MADEIRRLKVRANADTVADAKKARELGAEGIGLCRTEHMFFGENRIDSVRQMILSAPDAKKGVKKALKLYLSALKKLLPMQRRDFEQIFTVMDGLPVTIRLLDPPLHEFLPQEDHNQKEMAKQMKIRLQDVQEKVAALHELHPRLRHR